MSAESLQKSIAKKAKVHTRYKTAKGVPVPGVTTILGMDGSKLGALMAWANKEGLAGRVSSKSSDAFADIGTLIHYLVECDVKGVEPDLGDYSPNQVEVAREAFKKWVEWKSQHQFELIHSELPLVSEKKEFGGTLDVLAKVDGRITLIDVKTSAKIRGSHKTQTTAYEFLADENGIKVDDLMIARIGRTKEEGSEFVKVNHKNLHWAKFEACHALYKAHKNLEAFGED